VTVEVTNTDAEGRLVLADALAWGIETYKPAAVVNLATLTGAMVIALGHQHCGVMANNDELVNELDAASMRAGERIWRLPLLDEHRELLKSNVADILNSSGRDAGAIKGGAFLSYFVPRGDDAIPWCHMDVAGVADTEKELPYYGKGATGWGVRTLVHWVESRIANGSRS
jgi:leucyl aminopeptidase